MDFSLRWKGGCVWHKVVLNERDVSLHEEFLREVKELVGGEMVVLPRVFVKGRCLGGLEVLVELNETGQLGRILNVTCVEMGIRRQTCGGCGGARLFPCFDYAGSCKIVWRGDERVVAKGGREEGERHARGSNVARVRVAGHEGGVKIKTYVFTQQRCY
ncbi:Uncharacterized protein HKD37_18G050545 [Glycine soja]